MDTQPIILIMIDYADQTFKLTRLDGKEAIFPMEVSQHETTSPLSCMTFSPQLNALLLKTKLEDEIVLEVPSYDRTTDELSNRLIVYLDQNQWSMLDAGLRHLDQIKEDTREAAEQLAEWVKDRKVILPVSAGHYRETTKWSDPHRRYQLGLTMLRLSRGWQMRDPLQVRRDEIRRNFSSKDNPHTTPQKSDVFTLAPNVLWGGDRGTEPSSSSNGLSPHISFQVRALTSISAQAAVMLDPEPTESVSPVRWTQVNQQLSDWVDGQSMKAAEKRKVLDAALIADLEREIAEEAHDYGVPIKKFQWWLQKQATKDLQRMPALGVYREMLFDRHINTGTPWQPNDLTDIIYLSCAAGYADVVVTERHMAGILKQGVRRLGRDTQIFRRLTDAVSAIEDALT